VEIIVRPLREEDLPEADRIFRLAFGTFIGIPDPLTFAGDSDWIATRWRSDPSAAFAADAEGRVVGSNFATNWGSVGFFGPLSVDPDLWNQGVARRLLEPTMDCFTRWRTRHACLFTFAQSPKHVSLYQRFGFYARFLTAVMVRPASPPAETPQCTRFSTVPVDDGAGYLSAARELTGQVFDGLDVTGEIRAVAAQRLGDTLMIEDGSRLVGVAVCHYGAGSEAGSGTCYVKFAAARPGGEASGNFERVLDAVDAYAAERGAAVAAGVNLGREDAYRRMIARGFRTAIQGVAMHRPNEDAYNRRGAYVLDDWR
jgi:predicted N-acetyltransferase YhbS